MIEDRIIINLADIPVKGIVREYIFLDFMMKRECPDVLRPRACSTNAWGEEKKATYQKWD